MTYKSGKSAVVQELLGILASEMQNKQPLEEFLPACLAHVTKLVRVMDQAYTDVQLQFMLEHECWLVETFPHAYSHGFESKRACKCFSEKLAAARMWELHDGSQDRYKEFCTAYFNDPNAEGITECQGDMPPRLKEEASEGGPFIEPLGKPELAKAEPEELPKAAPAPLDQATLGAGPDDKAVRDSKGQLPKAAVAGPVGEPTMEPPFIPSASEEDDKEIEREMEEMQRRIAREVEGAEKKGGVSDADLKRQQEASKGKLKMRKGQAIECPYKSGSYEWCDYIIDGEPTLAKEGVAWDSKSTATKMKRQVAQDMETGDGPEAHAIVPSNEPLPEWARKKLEAARERNAKREASDDTQAKYKSAEAHWAAVRGRSKREAQAKQASQDRHRTQWERMKLIKEQKKLRKQTENEIAYDAKHWPWPKDDPEWDRTDVQLKPRKASSKPSTEQAATHSLAACAVSPLVLLVSIALTVHS